MVFVKDIEGFLSKENSHIFRMAIELFKTDSTSLKIWQHTKTSNLLFAPSLIVNLRYKNASKYLLYTII
jgi:hypothetical protein